MPAHKLQGRVQLHGLDISIENAKGSVRRWYDPHGKEKGHTKMFFDYGYARGTKGTDGDHVDVYVGPNPESEQVFVVNQMKKPEDDQPGPWKKFDEQKCMIGWLNAKDARAAYMKQYDDPRFFGGMKEMGVEEFRAKVLHKDNHGKKVAEEDMPFQSKRQQRAAFGGHIPGFSKEKAHEWAHETKNLKKLPDRAPAEKGEPTLLSKKSFDQFAQSFMELNLARLSAGEPVLMDGVKLALIPAPIVGAKKPGLGDEIPPQTDFAEAIQGDSIKASAHDRVEGISNHLDDLGIGILAAPYAANAASKGLGRIKHPMAQAASKALGSAAHSMHASDARELTGLALVAPGVTHRLAKGINKVVPEKRAMSTELMHSMAVNGLNKRLASVGRTPLRPQAEGLLKRQMGKLTADKSQLRGVLHESGQLAKTPNPKLGSLKSISKDIRMERRAALEKVAMQFVPDFEYMTEAEKQAALEMLGNLAGRMVGGAGRMISGAASRGGALVQGAKNMAGAASAGAGNMAGAARAGAGNMAGGVRDAAIAGRARVGAQFAAGRAGTSLAPQAAASVGQKAVAEAASMRGLEADLARGMAPGARPVTVPVRPAGPVASAPGSRAAVTATPPAGAPSGPGMLRKAAPYLAGAAGLGVLGVGGYAAGAGLDRLQRAQEESATARPLAAPSYQGQGRVF